MTRETVKEHEVISEKTRPVWEAKCRFIPNGAPGITSEITVSLRAISQGPDGNKLVTAHAVMAPEQAREYANILMRAADEAGDYDRRRDEEDRRKA